MKNPFWVRALPGALFLAYLVGTVLLFFFGPWRFPIEDRGRLVAFLVSAHLALAAGYLVGASRPGRPSRWRPDVARVATLCLLLDVVLLFPTSALNTGSWIPNPWAALDRLGDAYLESLRLRDEAFPLVNYVRILVAPLLAAAWPLGVVYWRRLGAAGRLLLAASVVGTLALYVAMGANMGAAHWMALFPWFVLAGFFSGTLPMGGRQWLYAGAIAAGSTALFALFFAATMNERHGSFAKNRYLPGIDAKVKNDAPAAVAEAAPEAAGPGPAATAEPAAPAEPGPVAVAYHGFAGYLSHGYYAVYLSLEEPFVPSYGVGNSVFLQRQVARLARDPSLLERSYPVRIEARGWDAYGYWATIYPWIASDVTFPGTVVVVFLVGWAFAAVWVDSLSGENPFAVAFLGQMLVMLYYFPAHNKTMHSGEGVVAFAVLGALWCFSRREGSGR
ncbi:MAG TPA: hypothetical protein VJG13_00650 [Thermoanaerobaculia bacterium]|nr:hypothetical protein [Thermoanaerobaculia bacterium]